MDSINIHLFKTLNQTCVNWGGGGEEENVDGKFYPRLLPVKSRVGKWRVLAPSLMRAGCRSPVVQALTKG